MLNQLGAQRIPTTGKKKKRMGRIIYILSLRILQRTTKYRGKRTLSNTSTKKGTRKLQGQVFPLASSVVLIQVQANKEELPPPQHNRFISLLCKQPM